MHTCRPVIHIYMYVYIYIYIYIFMKSTPHSTTDICAHLPHNLHAYILMQDETEDAAALRRAELAAKLPANASAGL